MQQIGIDERVHTLICDYVEGNLDEKKKNIIEKLASKSVSIRDLIEDSRFTRQLLMQHTDQLQQASLK